MVTCMHTPYFEGSQAVEGTVAAQGPECCQPRAVLVNQVLEWFQNGLSDSSWKL